MSTMSCNAPATTFHKCRAYFKVRHPLSRSKAENQDLPPLPQGSSKLKSAPNKDKAKKTKAIAHKDPHLSELAKNKQLKVCCNETTIKRTACNLRTTIFDLKNDELQALRTDVFEPKSPTIFFCL